MDGPWGMKLKTYLWPLHTYAYPCKCERTTHTYKWGITEAYYTEPEPVW